MKLNISHDSFAIRGGFAISRGSRTHAHVVMVTLSADGKQGRGECTPYARYEESVESVIEQIESVRGVIEAGVSQSALQNCLPAGAARNALDCALWDLTAKQTGKPVHELAKLAVPQDTTTAFTLSLDTPDKMAEAAYKNRDRPLLKVKLGGQGDPERLRAICSHAGSAKIVVDANEAWTTEIVWDWLDLCAELGVSMVEQPLPAGKDAILADRAHNVPLCADESAHDRTSLSKLVGLYDIVNIKLDKTGGLTEAIAMKQEAQTMGFGTFVGCMMGSSLAMAPAFLLTPGADYVDLDAPLLLAVDRSPRMEFEGSLLRPPAVALWG